MLIGITGKAGVGKDTVADELWRKHAFTRIAFADPMKRAAQEMFGLTDAETWSRVLKEVVIPYWGLSPRRIFQLIGTDAMQPTFGKDVWVKRWQLSYNLVKDSDHVIVPDVRFDHEAKMIRSMGGYVVKVEREFQSSLDNQAQAHISEAGVSYDLIDATIKNEGSIPDLHKEVMYVLLERGFNGQLR
jgi:hypothetical protein